MNTRILCSTECALLSHMIHRPLEDTVRLFLHTCSILLKNTSFDKIKRAPFAKKATCYTMHTAVFVWWKPFGLSKICWNSWTSSIRLSWLPPTRPHTVAHLIYASRTAFCLIPHPEDSLTSLSSSWIQGVWIKYTKQTWGIDCFSTPVCRSNKIADKAL